MMIGKRPAGSAAWVHALKSPPGTTQEGHPVGVAPEKLHPGIKTC